jgi:phenylacetate-CoA ligase
MSVDQQLREIILALYENAPAFRQRLDDIGLKPADLQTADDLAKLPILRKDDLIQLQKQNPPFGGLLAVPISEIQRVYLSPGPIHEPGPKGTDNGRWAPALKAAGFAAGQIAINAFSYHMTPAAASLESALLAVGCVVFPGGIGNQEQQIEAILDYNITNYVGLPSYLKALIAKAKEAGHTLPLRRAFVLAEPLPPSLRQELQAEGVAVYQGYGTAECGNLGYECTAVSGWHIPDGVIVQICDPVTGSPLPHGEQGEVVASVLSRHYAIVRFGVGDLSSINDEPCTCGLTSLRLNGWQGRVGAATKVRGMFLHPTQLANAMKRFPQVTAYQAVVTRQDHRDDLRLDVVYQQGANVGDSSREIAEFMRQSLRFRLLVTAVPAIPAGSPPIRDERSWE